MDEDRDREERLKAFATRLLEELRKNPKADIERLKNRIATQTRVGRVPKNAAILAGLPANKRTEKLVSLLSTRLTRTGSGVTPVAVMPAPYPCPGKCTYCPTATSDAMKKKEDGADDGTRNATRTPFAGNGMLFAPKSYTGFEPATMRAIQNNFEAKRQIGTRLSQYAALGQPTHKCELILMGGTFLSVPKDYRNRFVHECYEAFNGRASATLERAQKANETTEHRVIGLTVETRPDWCNLGHIDEMLGWGATRVELGVQSLDEEVLRRVKRGHDTKCTAATTANLKNAAFKVGYHFMPGLYSTRGQDVAMLRELFENPAYCPDMLKLYPCLVIPGTGLHDEWEKGRFTPIDAQEAVERIVEATAFFPPWVRVMRMQRDIPAGKIAAGVKAGNLHQMVTRALEEREKRCRCIRCREIFSLDRKQSQESGRDAKNEVRLGGRKKTGQKALDLGLVERAYAASGGREHFISFEDAEQDRLAGFVRLRLPPKSHRPEIDNTTALVRELHVYGQEVEIGDGPDAKKNKVQHTGLGRQLLARAEQIAREAGREKMVIISGVGAREYYRKFAYRLEGPYMTKKL
ncbi:MAG: tRNA uridine(34) 5-carboxymethylaminomethyl modification radical SAM/GNAT enzyme Elp3 [Candidatus Micrarchaeota archaeon]